uniref:protein-serine/threonine phosphatase n=1 Tax=Caenorhabditis tropicalis TaxID=1561998 RepID=A0A1I7UJS8_9PELO
MKELKVLSADKKKSPEYDPEDEADRIDTIEESSIPIADLLKRYGCPGGGKALLSAFLKKGGADSSDSDEDEQGAEEEEEDGEESGEKKEDTMGEQDDDTEQKGDRAQSEGGEKVESKVEETHEDDSEQTEKKSPEVKRQKVQKRCSKSPIQSEAKKSKSDESEAAASSSSAAGKEKSAVEEEDDDSDKDFVADEEGIEEEESDEDIESGDLEEMMLGGGAEVPGEDSGTTACVCLVGDNKVIVANAGDSRAVLCRAGKAIDLSVDHKPEDEIETARIHKAGGTIEDGRVNGGLNLSRALGDHAYKKNRALELKEQMITAHPDIKIETLSSEDEFLIVACDGIWNSLESQQVVDFVRDLLSDGKSCAEVCDALCDKCLADSTDGDGTGCDNMTVICTTFKR